MSDSAIATICFTVLGLGMLAFFAFLIWSSDR